MDLIQPSQVFVFLYAMILGVIFAVLYDFFKVIRYFNNKDKYITFAIDIIFMIICGLLYFYFSVSFNQGQIRAFTIIGTILGFLIYIYVFGRFTDKFIFIITKKLLLFFCILKNVFLKFTYIVVKIYSKIKNGILLLVKKVRNKKNI